MTFPKIQALGITQEGAATRWKATGYVDGVGGLEAWGTSLIGAMEALHALAAQRVAQREKEASRSGATCIAYGADGTLCRAPACILDHQRGGMVCLQHVPADVAEEITLYINIGTVEGRIDNHGEVYTWRLEDPRC
jgi:hypothetical protein